MEFVIWCQDAVGADDRRASLLPEHRDYVDQYASSLVLSGPLLGDDGVSRCGQFFVVNFPDREAVEFFINNDPFTTSKVFDQIEIHRFKTVFRDAHRV
jgi:uncharacterized protein YciI